jgi:RNA polymerase sigma factor (sigma-70 family)
VSFGFAQSFLRRTCHTLWIFADKKDMQMQMMQPDWQSTRFRQALVQMVKKRVPERDVEDVVQATLTDAVTAKEKPADPDQLRRWIWGIARHKVADFHRRSRREELDDRELGEIVEPEETNDMLRWAMKNLPDGSEETLQWLLREAEGEKLEAIAESANLPPARVRKRVSRLRAHLREHWQREVLALAALGVTLGVILWLWKGRQDAPVIAPITPDEAPDLRRARELRRDALENVCPSPSQSSECLRLLDEALRLDPAGDTAPGIASARARARTSPAPQPSSTGSALPELVPTSVPVPKDTAKMQGPSKPVAPKPMPRGSSDTPNLIAPPAPVPTGKNAPPAKKTELSKPPGTLGDSDKALGQAMSEDLGSGSASKGGKKPSK